jgi:hypothetical protein
VRRFLVRHFPTFARFRAEDWIMFGLTLGISFSIIWGIMMPVFRKLTVCFEGFGPACY